MFLKKREAEKKKKEDALKDAKEQLEESRKLKDKATSDTEGDLKVLVTYHEQRVGQKESEF